jgi:hypothetical protein
MSYFQALSKDFCCWESWAVARLVGRGRLKECIRARTIVKRVRAPAWWAAPRDAGTYVNSVDIPKVTWRVAMPSVAFRRRRIWGSTGNLRVATHIPVMLMSVVIAKIRCCSYRSKFTVHTSVKMIQPSKLTHMYMFYKISIIIYSI